MSKMDGSSKNYRRCCYRCSRCHLEVYRQYVYYDLKDGPICDPDCDGTKASTCIWCEQVIVGRPMLMFEKKVHRECCQYCVAKFGYEIHRRYTSDDWEQFREREVREKVEDFFDKFCNELVSDDEVPTAEDMTSECLAVWGKKGEQDWDTAIRKVMNNKKHASLPNITTCANEFKAAEQDDNQWRGLSEGESIGGGTTRSGNTAEGDDTSSLQEMLSESLSDKAKTLNKFHGTEERTEWLQVVQKSVCGDAYFDRESWADEAYNNTLGRDLDRCDVTKQDRRRHHAERSSTDSSISITNTFEGQQGFVDNIINEAVSIVQECNDEDIYKTTIDGKQVLNYDKVWERATRKRNRNLTVDEFIGIQDGSKGGNRHSEYNYVRNVLSSCEPSLVDKLIDEAASSYLESSDEECISGIHGNLRARKEGSGADDLMQSVLSKSWEEAREFRAMYEQTTSLTQLDSCTGRAFQRNVDNTSSKDTGGRESTATIKVDDQIVLNNTNSSETTVSGDDIDSKTPPKRRRRHHKQNVLDDGESSASLRPSAHEMTSNAEDLVYESASREKIIGASKNDLVLGDEIFDSADSAQSAANIADSGVGHILTEDQLDELFANAIVTSGNPGRLGQLVNEFKSAVGDIQHNANTCRDCAKSGVSSATSENERQSTCSAADKFDTVLTQLMDEVKELRNSILIFRKFARPDHFCETSVNGDLSSPQGEVYGTGNVLIIFDYGEEPLENDAVSVYLVSEYLANIYHDRESPRCFLHRTSNDRFDFSNLSEGNLSMYNGTDVTDSASTYRDVISHVSDEATSRVTGFENMSTYDELLWTETQTDRTNSSRSLQGSSHFSGDVFCTDVETQAWSAMLNAGLNEEISSTKSFVELTKNRKDFEITVDDEKKTDHSKFDLHIENKIVSEIAGGVSGGRSNAKKLSCDEADPHSGRSTTKQTDFQLLDRLRSIKRINFDDSVTNLRGSRGAIIVRKSVSESDVSAYELCSCTTNPSETSFGGANASEVEAVAWKEVRNIVSGVKSKHGLQHTASLGANTETTEVYQVAVEITINKRTELKGQKKQTLGRRRSSRVDMLCFVQDSTTWTDKVSGSLTESKPEYEQISQETVTNVNFDSKKMQSENVQEVEYKGSSTRSDSESSRYEVDAGTDINYLADDSSRDDISCSKSSSKISIFSHPLKELIADSTGSNREIEESIDSSASDKLCNIVDKVSNNNLISKESRNEVCKSSSKHDIGSNTSSKVHLSGRNSSNELDLEVKSKQSRHRKHPSEFNIDVDLFSSENITSLRERKSDHPIYDGTCSNEDLFVTGFVCGKSSIEGSKEKTDSVGPTSRKHTEEKQLGFLKEGNANIDEENSNEDNRSEQERKELFDVVAGMSWSKIADARNQVYENRYEHKISRRGSEHLETFARELANEEIPVDSLAVDGEINVEKSGACEIEFEIPTTSCENIESDNSSCRQTIERETLSDEVNSKISASDVINEAERNVGEDDSKSCDVRSQVLPEGTSITLTEEEIFIKSVYERETSNRTSSQTDIETLKHNDVDFKMLEEEEDFFLKSPNVPRSIVACTALVAGINNESLEHKDDVLETSLNLDLVSQELEDDRETVIASIDYNMEMPMIAAVSSKRCNLNILREIRGNDSHKGTHAYDFDNDTLVEEELGCMSLCNADGALQIHPPNQDDLIINTSYRSTKTYALNGASPNPKLENHHFLSPREVDNELSSRQDALHNTSSTTTGSDPESYKGNITEEEQEVYTLLSTSEYDIDHQWPSRCGSDPQVTTDDVDGASILAEIQDRSAARRVADVADVCGGDYIEGSRDEKMEHLPLAAGGEIVIQANSNNATRTSLVIDDGQGEISKEDVRDGNSIKNIAEIKNVKEKNKKIFMDENLDINSIKNIAEIKNVKEKNKKIVTDENLDEICRLDDDVNEAKHPEERTRVSESTTTEVVPPGGKKSKRKDKVNDGRRKCCNCCIF